MRVHPHHHPWGYRSSRRDPSTALSCKGSTLYAPHRGRPGGKYCCTCHEGNNNNTREYSNEGSSPEQPRRQTVPLCNEPLLLSLPLTAAKGSTYICINPRRVRILELNLNLTCTSSTYRARIFNLTLSYKREEY